MVRKQFAKLLVDRKVVLVRIQVVPPICPIKQVHVCLVLGCSFTGISVKVLGGHEHCFSDVGLIIWDSSLMARTLSFQAENGVSITLYPSTLLSPRRSAKGRMNNRCRVSKVIPQAITGRVFIQSI